MSRTGFPTLSDPKYLTRTMTPQDADIRSELGRILASESFAQSLRHREFLQYIVDETLAGRGDRIKGYTIATDVFGKDDDFDAQSDPYVRVEAGRLRKRLAEYYLAEGAANPVRVSLPKGSYQPRFRLSPAARAAGQPAAPVDASPPAAGFWSRPMRWAALGAVAVVIIAVYLAMQPRAGTGIEPTAEATDFGNLRLRIESFQNLGAEDFDFVASGLTQAILVSFDRWPPLIGAITVFHEQDRPGSPPEPHDYALTGTVAVLDDNLRVTASLVENRTGALIWSDDFDESLTTETAFEIEDKIATTIVDLMRDPLGPLIRNLVASFRSAPYSDPDDPTDCYLVFEAARGLRPEARAAALQCHEPFISSGTLTAAGWSTVSLLHYWAYEDGVDLKSGTGAPLEAAYAAAQRALDIDGNSGAAHMAMALAHFGNHQSEAALGSLERLMASNPPPSVLVSAEGLRLRIDGAKSMERFEAALRRTPGRSPYMYVGPALLSVQTGDLEQALEWAERIDAPEYTMAQVLWASLTAQLGQMQRAERHVANLLELHPEFHRYGHELVGRWSNDPVVVRRIVDGLSLAGIELASR